MLNVIHQCEQDFDAFVRSFPRVLNQGLQGSPVLVAEFEVQDSLSYEENIERLFRVTQNIDEPWTCRPEFGMTPKVEKARSTSLGDFVLDTSSGGVFRFLSLGYKEVTDEGLASQIRSLIS